MIISYKWLKQYLDLKISPEELVDKLTFSGIEVEKVEKAGENLKKIKVAKIISREKHPDADKLSVCLVSDGNESTTVVCGAPNCDAGNVIAFAPVGSKVISGSGDSRNFFELKKVKLRGIESAGMICSEKELGISDNHDEILVLPGDAPLGMDMLSYLDMEDTIFEVEITPNRPDLLGVIGVARDLSALLNSPLKTPAPREKKGTGNILDHLRLVNQEPVKCPRYTAALIKDVKVAKSPNWLIKALRTCNIKPVNNIVDVTNYVMMEYGHPLHAFDYNNISGRELIIRRAEPQEKFPALDNKEYLLSDTDLVIADQVKSIALAGIIGRKDSGIDEKTKDVVIEAACFHYGSIRNTASRLKLKTDSAYRFERNLSAETVASLSSRAVDLILELAGGKVVQGILDSYPEPQQKETVCLRPDRLSRVLNKVVPLGDIIVYLENLGLKLTAYQSKKTKEKVPVSPTFKSDDEVLCLYFQIPHFRKDLEREIDLIEEIARLYGYDKLAGIHEVVERSIPASVTDWNMFYAKRSIEDFLVNRGFSEVKNITFSDQNMIKKLYIHDDDPRTKLVKILNPVGSSFTTMRSSLIPGIMKNLLLNIKNGQKDLKLFEVGKLYFQHKEKLYREKEQLTIAMTGNIKSRQWYQEEKTVDFYDLKGIVEDLLTVLNLNKITFRKTMTPYFLDGEAAEILLEGTAIGNLGKLTPAVLDGFGISQPVYICEIDYIKNLFQGFKTIEKFSEINRFPSIDRDLSFVVDTRFEYADIKKSILSVNPKLIKKVELIDEYRGKNIKANCRSLTYNLTFSSDSSTLKDEFVNLLLDKVIKVLQNSFNIELR